MPPEPQVADSGGGASGGFAVGLPVPDMSTCPADTVPQGAEPPEGTELWCERADDGMRHGWYREWFPDGQIAVAGEYAEGLRVGVWTRWFPNGVMRVQAEFDDGMQDGMMIAWSDEGVLVYEASFSSGAPASIEP